MSENRKSEQFREFIEFGIKLRGGRSVVGPEAYGFNHPDGFVRYDTYTSVGVVPEGEIKPANFNDDHWAMTALMAHILDKHPTGSLVVWRRLPRAETDGNGWRATARLAFCRDVPEILPDE